MESTKKEITVIKASGNKELFDVTKLIRSLKNAGANQNTIEDIIQHIEKWIYSGVTTKNIYEYAFEILNRKTEQSTRYRLKQAIMELGPSGYPFEHFIGKIFEKQGYHTSVGVMVEGYCISHEMDVIATYDHNQLLIECKYSSDQGKNVSVQVPLYVRSRIDDIIKKRKELKQYQDFNFSGWVITNTRFSPESEEYARCYNLHLVGWDYPHGNGLKEMIEKEKIYPITILNSLNTKQKQYLIEKGFVICYELIHHIDILNELSLNHKKRYEVMKEIETISNEIL